MALFEQALELLRENRWQEVVELLSAQPEVLADEVELRWALGWSHYCLEDYQSALQTLLAVVKQAPENPLFCFHLGLTYCRLGQLEHGEKALRTSLALKHQPVVAGLLAEMLFEQGVEEFRQQRGLQAEQLWTEALELHPNHLQARFNRGLQRLQSGRFQPALSDFDAALDLEPGMCRALTARGLTYLALKRKSEAQEDLTKAVRLGEQDPQVFWELAQLCYSMKDYESACQHCSQALEREVADPGLVHWLRGHCREEQEAYLAAAADFEAAHEQLPGEPSLVYHQARALELGGKPEQALEIACAADTSQEPRLQELVERLS